MAEATLANVLDQRVVEGALYEKLDDNRLRCFACGHRCLILEGRRGVCKVRFNQGGQLLVPHGYVGALQCDPTEKKPFFHLLPGSKTLTFGMLGCDYHCAYCQNWVTSQTLRDATAGVEPADISAAELARMAVRHGARVAGSSYNEPLITAEWAVEVFREARRLNLKTAFISNGNGTPEALDYIRPWVDAYKVDLKSMQDKNYRQLGGLLATVLWTIRRLHEMRFWVEIVTLLIPGFNDSDAEIRQAADFLVSVSPDIPWHVTAFHKDYKMTGPDNTPAATLLRAAAIGKAAGLHYVYAGNLPGRVGTFENTYCHHCGQLLVERHGYQILKNVMNSDRCPGCRGVVPGVWV